MLAKLVNEIPEGDDWLYEPKWDGFRAMVFKDGDKIQTQSRDLKQERVETKPLVFTNLPEFPERESLEASTTDQQIGNVASSTPLVEFSDEVLVTFDEEGNQLVQPVFKKEKIGTEQFLVVPVNASEI